MMPSGPPSSPSAKNLSAASPQPPKSSSMVNSFSGVGNGSAGSLAPSTSGDLHAVDDRPEAELGVVGLALGAGEEVQEVLGRRRRRPR